MSKEEKQIINTTEKAFMKVYEHQQQIVHNQKFIYYMILANWLVTFFLIIAILTEFN